MDNALYRLQVNLNTNFRETNTFCGAKVDSPTS